MKKTIKKVSRIIAVLILFALILHFLMGKNWHSVFTLTFFIFLCILPVIIGFLTVYFSKPERAKQTKYQVIAPWFGCAFVILLISLFNSDIWKLWFVILIPLMVLSSVGGLLGGYLKNKQ